MFRLPSILLPVDFSERSAGAARYAKTLACRFHSELHLVHAVDLRTDGFLRVAIGLEAYYKALDLNFDSVRIAVARQLESFLPDDLADVRHRCVVLSGDPAQEIVKYADSENIALIVMPTHGYGPFRRSLLGSVTAKVLHDANCPVWTDVHKEGPPSSETISFGRVLCAIDPCNADVSALAWAWHFAREVGGAVKIVHTISAAVDEFGGQPKHDSASRAKAEIDNAQMSVGSQAEVTIVCGNVAGAVCEAARLWNANLMVIGRGVATLPLFVLEAVMQNTQVARRFEEVARSAPFARRKPLPMPSVLPRSADPASPVPTSGRYLSSRRVAGPQ